jgi:hypothetical protein
MSVENAKKHIDSLISKSISAKLEALKTYNEADEKKLYLVEDITNLLGCKTLWHKIPNLQDGIEKITKTLDIGNNIRSRTLLTDNGICKIIASMRKKPHELILSHFKYKIEEHIPDYSNIYISRINNIFDETETKKLYFEDGSVNVLIIIKFNIIIIFTTEIITLYSPKSELIKKSIIEYYPNMKKINILQFDGYTSDSEMQFDRLLKAIIGVISK